MAMSLEDLLAKEGFKRRKDKIKPRTSTSSIPHYMQVQNEAASSSMAAKRPERARSHIPRYDSNGDFSTSSSFKPRDNLSTTHGKLESEKTNSLRGRRDSWDGKRFSISSSTNLRASENDDIVEVWDGKRFSISSSKNLRVSENDEIVEVGMNKPYKDRYLNKVYSHNGDNNKTDKNNSFKHTNRPFLDHKSSKVVEVVPALDEVAVKAVISILSGYAKRFVEDDDFRTSVHHNSFASIGLDEGPDTQSKVMENLEQAIEIVERVAAAAAAENQANMKELKKASLQLSVITGLNSDDLKAGRLSACAHLYLSVIYVLQKKDGIAAKHLLQVFCSAPFEARTSLLPDLWDHVFRPHFLHLKLWYENETHSKVVERVYNESLDSGTYQFAMYYKDWIMDGVEEPSVPVIRIPCLPIRLLGHPTSPAPAQSMVSKQLYDQVFRHSHKGGTDEESVAARPEDKQLILYTQTNKSAQHSRESSSDYYIPISEEEQRLHTNTSLGEANLRSHMKIEDSFSHHDASETEVELSPVQETKEEIPEDFLCPLTGLLFKDPVTLETGQTFEREAITDWFHQGFITCPVTRKALQYKAVPPTNLILKRVIHKWKTDHIDHLLGVFCDVVAAAGSRENDDTIVCVLGQLLPALSEDERVTNGRRVISCGGLQFLVTRFSYANDQEKSFILSLLCCCIEADGGCRNDIARKINVSNLLQLLCSEQLKLRTSAVLLLIELICFNRRSKAKCFVESLLDEEIKNAIDHLSTYLHSCPLEQTTIVAVLILNLVLLWEGESSNIYRREAIDALAVGLIQSISDERMEKKCCRALLILGGFFSSSGKLMTEDWMLKRAGFLNGPDGDDESNDISADGIVTTMVVHSMNEDKEDDEEESAREKWLVRLSASLIEDGSKAFLDAVCKCVCLGKSDLVRVCLTTVAWLSFSLASFDNNGFQIRALSTLVSPLKQCLQFGELLEHRILASLCLYNFTTISECRRILVKKIGEEVGSCLDKLGVVTWTAKELHNIIISEQRR